MSRDPRVASHASSVATELNAAADTPTFWRRKVVAPLVAVLRQGTSPNQLALALALGWVTGTFPIIGITLLLCVMLATLFRLNQIAAQIANWLAYPGLFLLFVPHMRVGEVVCRLKCVALTNEQLRAAASQGFRPFLTTCGIALLHAIAGWLVLAPFVFASVYAACLPHCRRLSKRLNSI